MTRLRYTMFAVTVLLVLALSAMITVPALADDSTPPPTETPTAETLPTEEVTETAFPIVEEIPTMEKIAPVQEAALQEEIVTDLFASIPDGTEVVVVDQEGETIPLATQEAANAIEFVDPVWCPAGVAPHDGTGGCTDSFDSLKLLVDKLMAGTAGIVPNANGVIWIQAGQDISTESIILDGDDVVGAALGNMEDFSLTLKGGWNGTFGSTAITGFSSFNQNISITNWTGDITLSDITISGVTMGIPASNNAALNIDTEKKITLINVNVIQNMAAGWIINGAFLDNMDDSYVSDVVITNSTFNDNASVGLIVNSDGAITLANVLANGNDVGGAILNNGNAATAKAVTITTGTNSFSNNIGNIGSIAGSGLTIVSTGVITLKDITANNNGDAGIYVDNRPGSSVVGVAFTGTTIASENGGDGIRVYSDGVITASNLITNSNGVRGTGFGAYLANDSASTPLGVTINGSSNQFKFNTGTGLAVLSNGAITLNSITASNNHDGGAGLANADFFNGSASVTLTGTNVFNANFHSGLEVRSDGMITISNLTANDNGVGALDGYGAWLVNDGANTPKSVTLIGPSSFNGNYSYGLLIQSLGNISLAAITASSNGGGAWLTNIDGSGNVTISGAVVAIGNGNFGLKITSKGVVALNGVTANDNGGDGVYVKNDTASTPKAVTLNGSSNNFNNNGSGGLEILSLGSVSLNNIFASNNTNGAGLYVDNCAWNGSSCSGTGGITLNGTSGFFSNGDSGMEMYSTGNILIKDLDSNENGTSGLSGIAGYGAYLKNDYMGASGNVTVGTNRANWLNGFGNNFLSGLEIFSKGSVTLSNITANNNGGENAYGYGLSVINNEASTPKAVTLNGTFNEFNNNESGGVYIFSDGAITANEVTANDNLGLGALFVNNSNPSVPQNVTLNGYGEFKGNTVRGLEVQTYGTVLLSNIYADSNTTEGVFVDNFTGATMVKGITIKGYINVYNNGGDGLFVHTLGAITIANLDAHNNNNGATLDNSGGLTPAAVTITGNALTNDNAGYGMTITSKGAITINVTNAEIDNNGSYGWYLNNTFSGAVGGVTLTPAVDYSIDFNGNGGFGLLVQTFGAIKITNLDTNENGSFGAELNNAYSGSVGTVNITTPTGDNTFFDNGGSGLTIFSNRTITITNLYAESNGGNGVYLDNTASGAALPQPITINGSGQFYNNGDNGLVVLTYGAITTNNLTAYNNGQNRDDVTPTGWGVYLNNYLGTAISAKPVTLNGVNSFSGNYLDGLKVRSLGLIKANNVTASLNGWDGADLDNQWNFGTFGVTLTGSNLFESNGGDGLLIYSNGAITASNVSANWNIEGGAYLDNYSLTSASVNVTLTGTNNFLNNGDLIDGGGYGLEVYSVSTVTINNLNANGNEGGGAYINNYDPWSSSDVIALPNVKLTGVNSFNNNGIWGLYIYSAGSVDLMKITADNNGGGVYVDADGNITLTCGSITDNIGYGWSIGSLGTVTLKGVFSYGNGANFYPWGGTFLYTRSCPLP